MSVAPGSPPAAPSPGASESARASHSSLRQSWCSSRRGSAGTSIIGSWRSPQHRSPAVAPGGARVLRGPSLRGVPGRPGDQRPVGAARAGPEPRDVSGPIRAATQRRVRRCYPSQIDPYFTRAMDRDLAAGAVERVWFPVGGRPAGSPDARRRWARLGSGRARTAPWLRSRGRATRVSGCRSACSEEQVRREVASPLASPRQGSTWWSAHGRKYRALEVRRQDHRQVARTASSRSTPATTTKPRRPRSCSSPPRGTPRPRTAKECQRELKGKVVISMANALAKVGHEFQPLVPPRGRWRRRCRRPSRVRWWRRPSTTFPPRSSATSPIRWSPTCWCARTTPRPQRRRSTSCRRSPTCAPSMPVSCPTPHPSRPSLRCCCR